MAVAGAEAVKAGDFPAYVAALNLKRSEGEDPFMLQFQSLVEESSKLAGTPAGSSQTAFSPNNITKNRAKDAVPFDQNLVVLSPMGSDSGDYINASMIKGVTDNESCIATQAPLAETVGDFWRMVRQVQASVIVSLSRPGAKEEQPMVEYWSGQEAALEGPGLDVTVHSELEYEDFTLRTLILKDTEAQVSNWVYHLHHTNWPIDMPVRFSSGLMELLKFISHFQKSSSGPLVVHGCRGCGRTGTLIALVMVQRALEREGSGAMLDLYNIVGGLRRHRMKMVETVEQYRFLHEFTAQMIEDEADEAGPSAAGEAVAAETQTEDKAEGEAEGSEGTEETGEERGEKNGKQQDVTTDKQGGVPAAADGGTSDTAQDGEEVQTAQPTADGAEKKRDSGPQPAAAQDTGEGVPAMGAAAVAGAVAVATTDTLNDSQADTTAVHTKEMDATAEDQSKATKHTEHTGGAAAQPTMSPQLSTDSEPPHDTEGRSAPEEQKDMAAREEGSVQAHEAHHGVMQRTKSMGRSASSLMKRTSVGMIKNLSLLGGSAKKSASTTFSRRKSHHSVTEADGDEREQPAHTDTNTDGSAWRGSETAFRPVSSSPWPETQVGIAQGPPPPRPATGPHLLSKIVSAVKPRLDMPSIGLGRTGVGEGRQIDWDAAFAQREQLIAANANKARWPDLPELEALTYAQRYRVPVGPRPCPWLVA